MHLNFSECTLRNGNKKYSQQKTKWIVNYKNADESRTIKLKINEKNLFEIHQTFFELYCRAFIMFDRKLWSHDIFYIHLNFIEVKKKAWHDGW